MDDHTVKTKSILETILSTTEGRKLTAQMLCAKANIPPTIMDVYASVYKQQDSEWATVNLILKIENEEIHLSDDEIEPEQADFFVKVIASIFSLVAGDDPQSILKKQ